MELPQLLTIKEASKALKVHPNTIRLWEKEGLITSYRISGKRFKRYKKEDLLKLFETRGKPITAYVSQSELDSFYYKSIVESSYASMVTQTLEGIITTWNPAAEHLYGYSAEEAIGKPISFFVSPQSQKEFANVLQFIKKGQHFGPYKITTKLNNGKVIDMLTIHSPIKDAKGAVIGICTLARDYSEEKKAEDALRKSEARFRLVVEHSVNLIGFFDVQRRYVYVSPSHKTILGYSRDDLFGHPLDEIVHPDDLPALIQSEQQLLRGEPVLRMEFRLKHKDGRWITVEGTEQLIFREERPTLMAAIARDVTERKRLEDNMAFLVEASNLLASSLDYEQTLWSIAQLAVPRIAEFCAIDMINDKGEAELVAGWHQDPKIMKMGLELRKKYPLDMSAKEGAGAVLRTGKSLVYSTIPQEVVNQVSQGDEYLRLIKKLHLTSQMTVPLKVRNKVIGVISFATTESRRLTQSDLPFAEELAKRAALAIENARLFQESQKAVAARDDFMKMVSHELKTPVTSLKAYAQVLEREFRKKGYKEESQRVKKMDNQLSNMTRLITELLDLSRIQTGKLAYHKKLFAVDVLVQEVVEEMQLTAQKQKIVIKGKTNKSINADRDRIAQVLINVISNAFKYSEGEIIVKTQANDRNVTISVKDFGQGIPKEHLERIFEQFYQVNGHGGKTFPGLGIGLYLSSEIIKNHQGKIWVESEEGKGSTFSFTLPLVKRRED